MGGGDSIVHHNTFIIMTQCLVYDLTTNESECLFTLTAAKKWMRERQKLGHTVEGQRYKIYSNGDSVSCGKIRLTGNNKSFIANIRQTKKGY